MTNTTGATSDASTASATSGTSGTGGESSSSANTGTGGAGGAATSSVSTSSASSAEATSSSSSGGNGDCSQIAGAQGFGGSCYLDITTVTVSADQAAMDCDSFGSQHGVNSHLVTIADVDELAFVYNNFGVLFVNQQDLWLGYTCDSIQHPSFGDCNCGGQCPSDVEQQEANMAWSWVDGTDNGYLNWAVANPKGSGRCAALSKISGAWAWADRDCQAATFLAGQIPLTYRTVCEW